MPWMLQPKSYTQIARPNLYNVAYRRVGAYKGMGRLHPTNYLQIGLRPNRIGATTGQYNTLSGQLSLLPPSLRGLGQQASPAISTYLDASGAPVDAGDPSAVFGVDIHGSLVNLYTATTLPGGTDTATSGSAAIQPQQPQQMQKWLPWALGGGVLLLLLMRGRR